MREHAREPQPYWASPPGPLFEALSSRPEGLSEDEAATRATRRHRERPGWRRDLALLWRQFASPITLLLIAAVAISASVGSLHDAAVVLFILVVSALLGFTQERGAAVAVEQLFSLLPSTAAVVRGGRVRPVKVDEVVEGDVLALRAGDAIAADAVLFESRDLFTNESPLTGESFPAEKSAAPSPPGAPLGRRANVVFNGTHVVSGTGRALAVRCGPRSELGHISAGLAVRTAPTEFEHGLHDFGGLLLEISVVLVVAIFAINVYFHRPVIESLLFSMAIAVGLTPQLLPAVLGVNLAHGARRMARRNAIVKRLDAIEDLGAMEILCTDKTGTLTEGAMRLSGALAFEGADPNEVLLAARLNAALQGGYLNPIDEALRAGPLPGDARKLDEIPYDFERRRLTVLVASGGREQLITKGAVAAILPLCQSVAARAGAVPIGARQAEILERCERLGGAGQRVLAVAARELPGRERITAEDEQGLTLLGLVSFFDPPKAGVAEELRVLASQGVQVKIVTGDARAVARRLARDIGLPDRRILSGEEIAQLGDAALAAVAPEIDLFVEVEPAQKERIVKGLEAHHAVGFLGDGINDAPALHAADVGISVDTAAPVARSAASVVLLQRDLSVVSDAISEGRRTFANTLKYVYMATSANFGNMFSVAIASLFFPFLPLLPKQVLLANLLTDLPEMTIARDRVDPELLAHPRRWRRRVIAHFMWVFGLLSSAFDLLTFGVLRRVLHADVALFRTGWFVESVASAALVVLVIRTRRPIAQSRPSRPLAIATVGTVFLALLAPFTPAARVFGFVPLPATFLPLLAAIVATYLLLAELTKRIFFRSRGAEQRATPVTLSGAKRSRRVRVHQAP